MSTLLEAMPPLFADPSPLAPLGRNDGTVCHSPFRAPEGRQIFDRSVKPRNFSNLAQCPASPQNVICITLAPSLWIDTAIQRYRSGKIKPKVGIEIALIPQRVLKSRSSQQPGTSGARRGKWHQSNSQLSGTPEI